MYYKIVLGTTIVDAQESFSYVLWQDKNAILLSCSAEQANGILSSDGSVVWHLDGLPQFAEGEFATVEAVEISHDEYVQLVEQLKSGEEDIPDTPEQSETILAGQSTTELLLTVQAMQEEIQSLKEQNEFLGDCLLEMSEAVYA